MYECTIVFMIVFVYLCVFIYPTILTSRASTDITKLKTQRVIDSDMRAREREMDGRTGGQTDRARAEKEDRGRRGLFIGWSDTRDRLMLLALRCLCIYKRWACITHAPDKQLVFAPPNPCPSVC